jgi:hypothetical protein
MSDAAAPGTTAAAAAAPLAYAVPEHVRPRVALYRVAQVCWLVPLGIGLFVTLLFVLTRAEFFALFGFLTLFGGAALFGIGAICLVVFWSLLRNCSTDDRRLWSKRAWILFGLMLLNFPIAFGCAWIGATLLKTSDQPF